MQYDKMMMLDGAVIQYGPLNDRIYLMKIGNAEANTLIGKLDHLADKEGLGKIFVKVPLSIEPVFKTAGYVREAHVACFYRNRDDAVFLAKYPDENRLEYDNPDEREQVLALARTKQIEAPTPPKLPAGYVFRYCREEDADEICGLYRKVFDTYPFPIHDPDYIAQTMKTNVLYFSVRYKGQIVALSSAEIDREQRHAEMTDFATLLSFRGHSFASFLLGKMEYANRRLGIRTVYTIARAVSPGINITFARRGYCFGGTLLKNTNISGNIESMNVWHKVF